MDPGTIAFLTGLLSLAGLDLWRDRAYALRIEHRLTRLETLINGNGEHQRDKK